MKNEEKGKQGPSSSVDDLTTGQGNANAMGEQATGGRGRESLPQASSSTSSSRPSPGNYLPQGNHQPQHHSRLSSEPRLSSSLPSSTPPSPGAYSPQRNPQPPPAHTWLVPNIQSVLGVRTGFPSNPPLDSSLNPAQPHLPMQRGQVSRDVPPRNKDSSWWYEQEESMQP